MPSVDVIPPSARSKKRNGWHGLSFLHTLFNGQGSSAIGSDFTIEGNIKCNGHARLDGAVFGNVICKNLVVGKNGHIIGDIHAESIVIFGTVSGSVYCRKATLKTGSAIEGDIFHEELAIESGARFAGKSIRLPENEDGGDGAEADTSEADGAAAPRPAENDRSAPRQGRRG